MPDDSLPRKLFSGEVKGARSPGCPRSSFNDVVLHDCQNRLISVGLTGMLMTIALERHDLPCTYLAHRVPEHVIIGLSVRVVLWLSVHDVGLLYSQNRSD